MRICELRDKEVINVCSGRKLGCAVDVEINICTGEVEAVIVPGPGKICGFLGTDCEYVIPFGCIKKIGPDIILVEIQEEKFCKNIGVVYNKDSLSGSKRRKPAKQKGGRNYEMSILRKSGYKSD